MLQQSTFLYKCCRRRKEQAKLTMSNRRSIFRRMCTKRDNMNKTSNRQFSITYNPNWRDLKTTQHQQQNDSWTCTSIEIARQVHNIFQMTTSRGESTSIFNSISPRMRRTQLLLIKLCNCVLETSSFAMYPIISLCKVGAESVKDRILQSKQE